MYKPSFAGFVDVDLSDKKLSLRSLVSFFIYLFFHKMFLKLKKKKKNSACVALQLI